VVTLSDLWHQRTENAHLDVATDDLDGMLTKLAEQGVEPEKPYSVCKGGSRLCSVRDPDRYRT
jgi:hypothetical protein